MQGGLHHVHHADGDANHDNASVLMKLKSVVRGDLYDFEAVDKIFAGIGVLNALIATIPASLSYSLTPDYWTAAEKRIIACNLGVTFDAIFNQMFWLYGATMIAAFSSLTIIVCHYLVKPRNFQKWWHFGRFLVLATVLLTAGSTAGTLTLTNSVLAWGWSTDSGVCNFHVQPLVLSASTVLPACAIIVILINLSAA